MSYYARFYYILWEGYQHMWVYFVQHHQCLSVRLSHSTIYDKAYNTHVSRISISHSLVHARDKKNAATEVNFVASYFKIFVYITLVLVVLRSLSGMLHVMCKCIYHMIHHFMNFPIRHTLHSTFYTSLALLCQ